jgi:hypothetical protein
MTSVQRDDDEGVAETLVNRGSYSPTESTLPEVSSPLADRSSVRAVSMGAEACRVKRSDTIGWAISVRYPGIVFADRKNATGGVLSINGPLAWKVRHESHDRLGHLRFRLSFYL